MIRGILGFGKCDFVLLTVFYSTLILVAVDFYCLVLVKRVNVLRLIKSGPKNNFFHPMSKKAASKTAALATIDDQPGQCLYMHPDSRKEKKHIPYGLAWWDGKFWQFLAVAQGSRVAVYLQAQPDLPLSSTLKSDNDTTPLNVTAALSPLEPYLVYDILPQDVNTGMDILYDCVFLEPSQKANPEL
jgi:hypothetical protein